MFLIFGSEACGSQLPDQERNQLHCFGKWSLNHWDHLWTRFKPADSERLAVFVAYETIGNSDVKFEKNDLEL